MDIKSINTQFDQNSNNSNSIENQKNITKLDNAEYLKNAEKIEDKKQKLTEVAKQDDFNDTVNSVNDYVEMFNNKVHFTIDEKSREIIHVYDKESGDLIRQIPPEEMIELVDKLEEVAGIIFNNKV